MREPLTREDLVRTASKLRMEGKRIRSDAVSDRDLLRARECEHKAERMEREAEKMKREKA